MKLSNCILHGTLNSIFAIFVVSATPLPVLQRTNTPHPRKASFNPSSRFTKAIAEEKAKPIATLETLVHVNSETSSTESLNDIKQVKALVCLKCILQFDEFKSFYGHKCESENQ